MKKFIMPITMAVAGILAVAVIFINVTAVAPVTLKLLRVDDVAYNLNGGDTIKLATGVESVYVDARPTDGNAVVEIKGDKNFKEGKNTLSIKVTGSDGKSNKTYTMTLIMPKLSGWCESNAQLIKTIETNWSDEQIYGIPGYAELGTYASQIRSHTDCFSTSLVSEVNKNY
ncbi:MAG: hypothetical protein EBT82_00880 [Micrococcales bacterium]|nr:hypothetical protein [Micrococcales bacterium]NBT46549.1 hypothetical protein [Actinomycetota bacterium]